jgi:hypothetical protein
MVWRMYIIVKLTYVALERWPGVADERRKPWNQKTLLSILFILQPVRTKPVTL